MNLGISAARAPVVHLLACGAQVGEGWVDAPLARFSDPRLASVASLLLDANGERIASAGVGYSIGGSRRDLKAGKRAAKTPAVVGEVPGASASAAFYRRTALGALSVPFDPAVGDAHADIDLALRLRRGGWSALLEPASRVVAPPAAAPSVSQFSLGRQRERLFWRHRKPTSLALALTAHTASIAMETCGAVVAPKNLGRLAGRMFACLEWGFYARDRIRLEDESRNAARALARSQSPKSAPTVRAQPLRKAA